MTSGYNNLVTIYQQTGKLDSARYYLSLARQLAERNSDKLNYQYNYNQSAGLFYKNLGEFKQALPFMLKNLELWKKQDENRAGQLLNLGNLYFNMGNYKSSTSYHLQALSLFEKLNNLRGQSFCFQSLGNDFFLLKQFTHARSYFERSLKLKEKLGDRRGYLNSSISLGDVHKELNQFKQAEKYYNEALQTAKSMNLVVEEARVWHQRGLLYQRTKDTESARNNFIKSIELFKQLGDSLSLIKSKSELRNLEQLEQNKNRVEYEMLESLNTIIRMGDRQQEIIEYERLSEYYALNKNFEKALYYTKKYQAISDSIEGRKVLVQVKELEEKYNTTKKEKEIELLKKDQELQKSKLKQQNANIVIVIIILISVLIIGTLLINRYRVLNQIKRQKELEQIRQNIARDLHDDIGSILSSINIMSKVAMNQHDNNQYLQKISDQAAIVMETMGDMIWSINPDNDTVEQVIIHMREFANEILESKNIEFLFEEKVPEDVVLNAEKRRNLFLIFKEAINNAAKYSHATRLNSSLKVNNKKLYLQVVDNGKGFIEGTIKTGNGLRNLRSRASEIGGILNIKSTLGEGTIVELQLPLD